MSIMGVQEQADIRGSTRVLASAAKRYINHIPDDRRHIPAMNGVFRLLKAYRVSNLKGYEYQSSIDRGTDAVSLIPSASVHVAELRIALGEALEDVGGEPSETLATLEHAIRQAARESTLAEGERATTLSFLDALINRLHAEA